MGSHRARHRADQGQSEELATDLLARLADEARPRPTRTRHTPRSALDPFSTAPFPAHTPQTAEVRDLPGDAGSPPLPPAEEPDHSPGVRPARAADDSADGSTGDSADGSTGDSADASTADGAGDGEDEDADDSGEHRAAYVPMPRFPSDPDAPFLLDDAPADPGAVFPPADAPAWTGVPFPRGVTPAGPGVPFPRGVARAARPDAPRTAYGRLATLRRKPIYAAVSATVITATVATVASAEPAVITPPAPTADRTSPALAAAALDLAPAPKPGRPPAPVAPQLAGGAAVLAPAQGAADPRADSPVLGSTIAARAAADAKAYAAAQGRQAAARTPGAPRNAPAPKPAPKAAPQPAAATGNGVGARALGLARGKLGDPYVWGAAGPSAFDCSGLIVWAYKQLGVALPHSSASLSTMGAPVSKAALQPGDLVFFYSPVSHVGIYAGNGMVLNATQSGEPVQYSKLANLPFHNAVRITR